MLFSYLDKRGVNPSKEVQAGAWIADIVTDEAVYEVIAIADTDAILAAVTRVLASRNELNHDLKPVIFGWRSGPEPTTAIEAARKWGVIVNLLDHGEMLCI